MKNTIMSFIKDYIFIILGGLCIVIIGIIYIIYRGQGRDGRFIVPSDVIYNSALTGEYAEPDTAEASAHISPPPMPMVTETAPVMDIVPIIDETLVHEAQKIVIHIVGEVNNPGVFELVEGSRVNDVLQMAGGATEYADLARINLAALLHDAMQIIVPGVGDDDFDVFIFDTTVYEETGNVTVISGVSSGLVNINTATLAELQTLPGIGPVLAGNIIEFRESHGGFTSVDELINVARIGVATLDRIRDLVTAVR